METFFWNATEDRFIDWRDADVSSKVLKLGRDRKVSSFVSGFQFERREKEITFISRINFKNKIACATNRERNWQQTSTHESPQVSWSIARELNDWSSWCEINNHAWYYLIPLAPVLTKEWNNKEKIDRESCENVSFDEWLKMTITKTNTTNACKEKHIDEKTFQ